MLSKSLNNCIKCKSQQVFSFYRILVQFVSNSSEAKAEGTIIMTTFYFNRGVVINFCMKYLSNIFYSRLSSFKIVLVVILVSVLSILLLLLLIVGFSSAAIFAYFDTGTDSASDSLGTTEAKNSNNWITVNHDIYGTRNSNQTIINKDNVAMLQVK